MIFAEAFEKLDLEETAAILDRLNPEFDEVEFDPVNTTIMALDLPFYKGCRLLEIADYTQSPPRQRFAVYGPEHRAVLDFTNAPIYALNKDVPVKLTEKNIGDYLRFFFTYVRGRHGRFLIAENVDDIQWREEPPPAARKAIGKMLIPVALKNTGDGGAFHLEVSMVFKDSLFKSKVVVTPEGLVTLKDEELLVEDMPVLDDVFAQ